MKTLLRRICLGLAGLVVIAVIAIVFQFFLLGRQSEGLLNAGMINGTLQDCPDRPSCVNSMAEEDMHAIAPFPYDTSSAEAINRLANIISEMPRTELRIRQDNYIHATFASALFGFVDDVEFLLDGTVIQVRSVSRVGYGDMGVNRNRIEEIRRLYNQQ
jgi:uncharacterized protein (DUF1499 family)